LKYRQQKEINMTHIVLSSVAHPAKMALSGRLVAAIRMLWRRLQNERRLRATVLRLHRLNDHSLRDIGLERDNIEPVVRSRHPG
jgi:uncharacterized protein YjiS (DUF1127 family)